MKKLKSFFVVSLISAFAASCASYGPVADTTTDADLTRDPASVVGTNWAAKYREYTMVNVVTVNRYPASEAGMKEISKPADPVTVVSQVYKSPGEKLQHSMLLFTVKKYPQISGQIVGNNGGAELSTKFTQVVARIQSEGVTPKVAGILSQAQTRLSALAGAAPEQRADGIKRVLYDTREKLLAAY